MKSISPKTQQQIWDKEHTKPFVLPQMDSHEASSGVITFIDWLKQKDLSTALKGIEIGCGKGRNIIGLARLGLDMTGIDFSPAAIREAKKRAKSAGVSDKTHFQIHDATVPWPFFNNTFDIAIDCFATTDIEDPYGRKFAVNEIYRILKPEGFLMAYLLSPEDEFHNQMVKESPARERNAFIHPTTGKFEKSFDRDEILAQYDRFKLIEEKRIEKSAEFFGKSYKCFHYWMIFQK